MNSFHLSYAFLTLVFGLVSTLILISIIGRPVARLLPYGLRSHGILYLSPIIGVGMLTLFGSLLGRWVSLGDTVILPLILGLYIIYSLTKEQSKVDLGKNLLLIIGFGFVCSFSLLSFVFLNGGVDPHNDVFTYLAHSSWLLDNAFSEQISPELVEPLTTQIALYQRAGLRMGASFLLALLQTSLNVRWAFDIYPVAIAASMTAGCLAVGFALTRVFRHVPRMSRYLLLATPALALGGLSSGGNSGFFPQTLGLGLALAFIVTLGATLNWIATQGELSTKDLNKTAVPLAILISGSVYAYSEFAPLLLAATLFSFFYMAIASGFNYRILYFVSIVLSFATLILNSEILRAYSAIRVQSGAVVGMFVDWPAYGFLSHILGIHGGAFDPFQWSSVDGYRWYIGAFMSITVAALLMLSAKRLWPEVKSGRLLPILIVLGGIGLLFIYYRFFVPNPFAEGVGQSWNQYKLSDWGGPFASVLIIFSLATIFRKISRLKINIALMLLVFAAIVNVGFANDRSQQISKYYSDNADLSKFFRDFRKSIDVNCGKGSEVYLDLNGSDLKFRQIAALYLHDRKVISDWTDDVYINHILVPNKRNVQPSEGTCIVTTQRNGRFIVDGRNFDKFVIGFVNSTSISIENMIGSYGKESDQNGWWVWTERRVDFKLKQTSNSHLYNTTKVSFEYGSAGGQRLRMILKKKNGEELTFELPKNGYPPIVYEKIIAIAPEHIDQVSLVSNDQPQILSQTDPREVSFITKNLRVTAQKN